jgi:hypothetical protein
MANRKDEERYARQYNQEEYEDEGPEISGTRGGMGFAALIGVATGLLDAAIVSGITLLNSPLYTQIQQRPTDTGLAYAGTYLWCLGNIIGFALCSGAGFIVGKRTLQRNAGFVMGVVAAFVITAGGALIRLIPGYPDRQISSVPVTSASVGMGIAALFIGFLILAVILGLFGRWGASLALRRKPEPEEDIIEYDE